MGCRILIPDNIASAMLNILFQKLYKALFGVMADLEYKMLNFLQKRSKIHIKSEHNIYSYLELSSFFCYFCKKIDFDLKSQFLWEVFIVNLCIALLSNLKTHWISIIPRDNIETLRKRRGFSRESKRKERMKELGNGPSLKSWAMQGSCSRRWFMKFQ